MKPLVYRGLILLLLLCVIRTGSSSATSRTDNEEKELFLTAHISNDKPFTGEAVELTYTLSFTGIAPKILDTAEPSQEGIWVEETTLGKLIPSRPQRIGDTLYRNAVIKQMTLVPLQAGRFSITGYSILCIIPKSLSIDSPPEPDDSLALMAPEVTIDVNPLPEPIPSGFSGAVGILDVTASADRDTIHAGKTLRLTGTLTGTGNFKTFPALPWSLPEGFSVLETIAEPTSADSPERLTKTIVLKADKPGTFTFSPLSFTSFDPERKTYVTVESNKLTLAILPETAEKTAKAPDAAASTTQDKSPERNVPAVFYNPLFTLSFIVVVVLLYLLLKRRSIIGKSNPKPAHSPQELREQLSAILKQGYGFDVQGLTRKELTQAMEKQGVDDTFLAKLLVLLDELDRLEFAPGEPDAEELENLRQKCNTLSTTARSRPSRSERTS